MLIVLSRCTGFTDHITSDACYTEIDASLLKWKHVMQLN